MSKFMKIKSVTTKVTQELIAKELVYSDSLLKRYRIDLKMKTPHRIFAVQNALKRPQKTLKILDVLL